MQILLSIVIPTHNRATDLFENLEALYVQCSNKPVEIVVIDSASDPAQAEVLRALERAKRVTFIRLDRPGVSIARNAGIAQARGTWLGFLDDDVVPAADWVDSALARIAASDETVGVVAGRVLPRWPRKITSRTLDPAKLGRRSRIILSVIDDTRVYCTSAAPFGISANLLIRQEALAQAGGFPEGMGRVRESLASGEDPYVIDEIARLGFECWYDGALCVEHKIYERQLTPAWIARRAWHEGLVSLRKCASRRAHAYLALKCLGSLPILSLLRVTNALNSEYIVRLHHNLGFLSGMLGFADRDYDRIVAEKRPSALRSRAREPQCSPSSSRPSVAVAFPHDDAGA